MYENRKNTEKLCQNIGHTHFLEALLDYGSEKHGQFFCCIAGCIGVAEVGTYVYNMSAEVHGEYIVPTCKRCNAREGEFFIDHGT